RTVGGGGYRLRPVGRRVEAGPGQGLAGDPGLRHGAPEGAEQLRHRSHQIPGLRLRHGDRAHRDAEIWHPRFAHLLRRRPALAEALRLRAAGRALDDRRAHALKFTLKWLKEHLDTQADVATIARTLTMIGLEVEGIEDRAKELAPFTIGYVVEAVQHPNADKLRVCKVDTGKGVVQVVCGAPNARTGMKGVFAPPGSFIPGTKLDLKPGVIRGVESNGMLCSMREMGLGQDHDGIIDLAADAPLGQSFAAYMGYDDPVFEIKLTPDRADCLGVHGIARDLAAAGLGTLKPFEPESIEGTFESPLQWQRTDVGSACPLAVGRYFRNVKNGPSPQ